MFKTIKVELVFKSVIVGEVVPIVLHVEELGVVEACTTLHIIDLCDLFLRKSDFGVSNVLSKAPEVGRLHKRDCIALSVPSEDHLSSSLAFGGGNLSNDWICEWVQLHELIRARLPVTGADGGVALQIHTPLAMEHVDLLLIEVGVHLNLVYRWLDAASGDDVSKLGHYAVAHADRFRQTGIDESLHTRPGDMLRW